MITVPDEIRAARMLLRKPRAVDAPLMFSAYAQDPAVTRYRTWRPHADIAETRAVIDRFLAAWERQEEFCWLLFTSDAGQLIGSIAARTEDGGFNLLSSRTFSLGARLQAGSHHSSCRLGFYSAVGFPGLGSV